MTKEKQHIAIAGACGWTKIQKTEDDELVGICPDAELMDSQGADTSMCWVPDYPADLNAMHEAEKALSIAQTRDFLYELERITKGCASSFVTLNEAMRLALLVHATAAQRAEAFLKAKNLWKPSASEPTSTR